MGGTTGTAPVRPDGTSRPFPFELCSDSAPRPLPAALTTGGTPAEPAAHPTVTNAMPRSGSAVTAPPADRHGMAQEGQRAQPRPPGVGTSLRAAGAWGRTLGNEREGTRDAPSCKTRPEPQTPPPPAAHAPSCRPRPPPAPGRGHTRLSIELCICPYTSDGSRTPQQRSGPPLERGDGGAAQLREPLPRSGLPSAPGCYLSVSERRRMRCSSSSSSRRRRSRSSCSRSDRAMAKRSCSAKPP